MVRAVLRLTALLVCVGLATSRIGLVVHELIGHGGATLAVGGTVTNVWLFTFAGGWIRFRATGGHLVIAMGGIAVEAVIGALLVLVFARREQLAGRIVRAIGCALIIHASWYLATGTWHGYGDGVQLHRLLGDSRWIVAVPAALVACAAGYAGAKIVLGSLAATVPGSRRARFAGTVVAIVLAGGIQLGAALGEVALRRDPTYATAMRPERERVISREMGQWIEAQHREGQAPSDADRARMRREVADRHATFPFAYVLGGLLLVSIGLGAACSPAPPGPDGRAPDLLRRAGPTLSGRVIAIAAAAAGGSVALVIALDALLL